MFTGIIKNFGQVVSIEGTSLGKIITLSSTLFTQYCQVGDSIAVNGVCLTITSRNNNLATFDIASETIRRTSLASVKENSVVNLESSMRIEDKIDGHLVYGHVDTTAFVERIEKEGDTWKFSFGITLAYARYLAPKGSVSIDGVSLTIGESTCLDEDICVFSVYIIPHTFENTIFKFYSVGSIVNIEIDPLSRYAIHALAFLHNNQETKKQL